MLRLLHLWCSPKSGSSCKGGEKLERGSAWQQQKRKTREKQVPKSRGQLKKKKKKKYINKVTSYHTTGWPIEKHRALHRILSSPTAWVGQRNNISGSASGWITSTHFYCKFGLRRISFAEDNGCGTWGQEQEKGEANFFAWNLIFQGKFSGALSAFLRWMLSAKIENWSTSLTASFMRSNAAPNILSLTTFLHYFKGFWISNKKSTELSSLRRNKEVPWALLHDTESALF